MYKRFFLLTMMIFLLSACVMKEEDDNAPVHSSYYYINHFPKAVEVVKTCEKKENRKTQFCKDNLGTAFLTMMKYHKYNPSADLNELTPENAPEKAY